MTTSNAPAIPRPAATTVLLRAGAPFEAFLIKRAPGQRFMGGSHVFPGGRVDDADRAVVDGGLILHPGAEELGLRMKMPAPEALGYIVAAARELLEEAGVLIAPGATREDAEEIRKQLMDGTSFAEALKSTRFVLDGKAFNYLAYWVTPVIEPRRFTARFFVTVLPEGQETVIDENEAVAGEWYEPRNAVAAHLAKEIVLPPPTVCVLDALTRLTSLRQAAQGAQGDVPVIEPIFIMAGDDRAILAFPNDPLHPVRYSAPHGTPTRVEMRDGVWTPLVVRRDDA